MTKAMARIEKKRLDFFPFDIDFFDDEKIVSIFFEFGSKGELVAVKLLCEVYRNGYFLEWKETIRIKLVQKMSGVSVGLLDHIVRRLVKWGFFDKTLFDTAMVLTSVSIQSRYFASYSRQLRPDLPYLLITDVKTPVCAAKTGVIAAKTVTEDLSLPFDDEPLDDAVIAAKTGVIDVKTAKTGVIAAKTQIIAAEMPTKETKQDNSMSSLRSDSSTDEPLTQEENCHDLLDFDAFVMFFNAQMAGTSIPCIKKLTPRRKDVLRARCREYGKEDLATVIRKAAASSFLNGGGGRFKATFDWIFGPINFPKVLEGNYDNTLNQTSNGYGTNSISGYRTYSKPTKQQRIREDLAEAAEHFKELIKPAEGVHNSVPGEVWRP